MQPTLHATEIETGQNLPDLDIPVTSTPAVRRALASRDFTPAHQCPGEARTPSTFFLWATPRI